MGLKKAAVARLCLNGDIYRAMPEVCDQYLPQPAPGYPAPPPVPISYAQVKASEEQTYTIRDIWLVEGTSGKNRLCNDYDATQQRCRVWADVGHHAPKKVAMASPKKVNGAATQNTATKPSATALAKAEQPALPAEIIGGKSK